MANPEPGQKPQPTGNSGGSKAKTSKTTTASHEALLAILIEATGIVIVVTVAGVSEPVANLLLVFSIGLWLLYLVMNADTVAAWTYKLTNIESGATK